jgi:hypothetical protein
MMNGKKHGCRTADIQGGAVRQPGEYSDRCLKVLI